MDYCLFPGSIFQQWCHYGLVQIIIIIIYSGAGLGSRVGAVVRALASHQCVPGSIPGPGVIYGSSLLLVLYSAPRGFSPGTPVFPSLQKPTFLNSNSIWTSGTFNYSSHEPLARVIAQALPVLDVKFTFTFTVKPILNRHTWDPY